MHLQMELTNRCNLLCIECPHVFMKREQGQMSEEVFNRIIDDYIIPMKPETVILHKDGEPLLYKNIKGVLQKITEVCNSKIDIYTNGLLLTQDFCNFLGTLKNPISLLVSFHFYNKDGKKNDYAPILTLLKEIVLKSRNLKDSVIFVSHKTKFISDEELNEWRNEWLPIKQVSPIFKDIHINPTINKWAGKIEEGNSIFEACPYNDGEHLFIGYTGNVLPCCIDLEEEITFGNILVDSKEGIMERRQQHYDNLYKKICPELCRRCLV